MAIQATYTFEKEGMKHVIPNAYIRIIKIVTSVEDVEVFEKVEPNEDGIDQILKYDRRIENRAISYVYAAKEARDNYAYPMEVFPFNFKLDLESNKNIFSQAYDRLKNIEGRISDSKDV